MMLSIFARLILVGFFFFKLVLDPKLCYSVSLLVIPFDTFRVGCWGGGTGWHRY